MENEAILDADDKLTRVELLELPLHLPERRLVLEWMLQEWTYSNEKFKLTSDPTEQRDDHDASMAEHGFQPGDGFWFRQVTQYFDRARMFGVGEPESVYPAKGQQAMLKALMTLFDCCAAMIRVHGLPPEPGHTSGEIVDWKDGAS